MMDNASSIDIVASGGVSTEEDIIQLRDLDLYGAIIGKALYEGKISLEKILGGQRG
jgi:phosphoribosylformimino-5-aminoimidazole carboxamide ribotide isomerase